MMSKKEAFFISLFVIVFITGSAFYMRYWNRSNAIASAPVNNQQQARNTALASCSAQPALKTWALPKELNEISSNILVSSTKMACIQDNDGFIFFYDLANKRIDSKLKFAGPGDYEGLTLVANTFYVLRSDGFLFEVQPGNSADPTVKTYDLPLSAENNVESLCYDNTNNRLLVAVKEKDLTEKDKKGVYAFDLSKKQMSTAPVFYIQGDEKASSGKKKKKKNTIKPSEMAINPITKEFYVLNGPRSELLILDGSGNIKSTIQLDKNLFPQPEGLCFGPKGELYISSEASKKGNAIIAQVKL
jgi:uncharacterized protein YjiK